MPPSNSRQQREPELPLYNSGGTPTGTESERDRGERLNSWKEISVYLGRDPRTAQRWEKFEGLPIHRHVHGKAGSVYAFAAEIDAWQQSRLKQAASFEIAASRETLEVARQPRGLWVFIAAGSVAALLAVCLYVARPGSHPLLLEPVPLSSLPVEQLSPSFSPDGKSVVFTVGDESGKSFHVYVKPMKGGGERRIAAGPALNYSPAWSPDGKMIAYLSGEYGGDAAVWLVSPNGTDRRKLCGVQTGVWPWNRALAWTPDSRALIVTDTEKPTDSAGLFRIGLDGSKRRITDPPPRSTDSFPSVSADGKRIVFTRFDAGVTRVYEQMLADGHPEPRLICSQLKDTTKNSAVWLGRSNDLLLGTGRAGAGQLWRVSESGKPVLLTYLSQPVVDVAVSANGDHAAFALRRSDANIWTMPLPPPNGTADPTRDDAITSTRDEYNAQYSPDGTSIAFESNRSGSPEIWISGLNGDHLLQLTHFQGPVTGSPHWSPDGKWITFDSRVEGHAAIFVIPSVGGDPKRITPGDGPNVVPFWSHGGEWIYFASNRTARHQLWRIHPDGSDAVQVTRDGGFYAEDTPDGKTIYYTKQRDSVTSLWRISFDGSNARQVAAPVLDRCFAVTSRGVYFASASNTAVPPELRFLPFGSREAIDVTRLPQPIMYGLAVSPDGRQLLFAQLDTRAVELMVVNGPFR